MGSLQKGKGAARSSGEEGVWGNGDKEMKGASA